MFRSSVKRLLDVLQQEWDAEIPAYSPPLRRDSPQSSRIGSAYSTPLTDEHRRIRMRLSPLLFIETSLNRWLLPDNYSMPINEACVRAGSGWKNMLRSASTSKPGRRPGSRDESRPHTGESRSYDDPTAILAACRNDIIALWEDPVVRRVLDKHNFRPEEQPGL
jgi:guanine nucleotide-binding protein alpha-1 subunit